MNDHSVTSILSYSKCFLVDMIFIFYNNKMQNGLYFPNLFTSYLSSQKAFQILSFPYPPLPKSNIQDPENSSPDFTVSLLKCFPSLCLLLPKSSIERQGSRLNDL